MKASDISSRTTALASASHRPPRPERIRLTGRSTRLDPRIHAARADIADVVLADRVFAPHYARSQPMTAAVLATIRAEPRHDARAVSQILRGERFCVVDLAGGWAWGSSILDDYVGYVPADALAPVAEVDHVVDAVAALVFAAPDIKAPLVARWPMGTRFAGRRDGDFLVTDTGFVHARHAAALDMPAGDPVMLAERLLGQPYLWGGRSGDAVDCSGLVQLALQIAGHADVPRDSDLQRMALGRALDDSEPLRRGDVMFFPGHVGLMADGERLLHANAHWMAVTIEPLADVIARFAQPDPILARKRLDG